VPARVRESAFLAASDLWKAKEARFAFGIVGSDEYGPLRIRENFQVRQLIQRYRRQRFHF
jgi:hypothetical protein